MGSEFPMSTTGTGLQESFDVAIVGAGPSGLCLASAVSNSNLRVAVIERLPLNALCTPAFDGREIALTHASVDLLREIGAWQHIDTSDISPIEHVRVLNGHSRHCMHLGHGDGGASELGWLVSNHLIRRAAWLAASSRSQVTLMPNIEVRDVRVTHDSVQLCLSNGNSIRASLVVAADSRFSEVRRQLGIRASMRDFGSTMLVCRMEHEHSHFGTAWEWFDYGQTLALLPLKGNRSSIVITVPGNEARRLRALSADDFSREVQDRFRGRLGSMRLVSDVFAYPLVAVMPDTFVASRCALVGDAAVGMHPVTAHGFNLGLLGAGRLASLIVSAAARGQDVGSAGLLELYCRNHRRAALPLFLATNAIVRFYTDERLPARVLRHVLLRIGNEVVPFRRAFATSLTRRGAVTR